MVAMELQTQLQELPYLMLEAEEEEAVKADQVEALAAVEMEVALKLGQPQLRVQ
jgi:hypothetical protein